MTSRFDIERVLDRYLADGGEQVPDRVIDAALDQIERTHQRRAVRVPWRFQQMPSVFKLAVAGAAVVAVLVVGSMYLGRGPTGDVGGPGTATPSPTSPASPSAVASPSSTSSLTGTSAWRTFTSERYGYRMGHPASATVATATREWELADRNDHLTPGADQFFLGDADLLVTAFADDLLQGMSQDDWSAAYWDGAPVSCRPEGEAARQISVGGHAGTLVDRSACSEGGQVVVFLDNRVHVFAVWRESGIEVLEAFVSTVEFVE